MADCGLAIRFAIVPILQRGSGARKKQFDFIIRVIQKQRNITAIGRLNIMAQGSRFESSKPDLNELAALDILFVKNDMQSGASRRVRQVHVVYNLKEGTRNDAKINVQISVGPGALGCTGQYGDRRRPTRSRDNRTAKSIVFGYNGDAGKFCVGTRLGIQPERGFRRRLCESWQPGWHLVRQYARRGPIRRCLLPTNCQSRSRTRTLDYT